MSLYSQTLKKFPSSTNSTPPMTQGQITTSLSPYVSESALVVKAGEIINGGKVVQIRTDGKAYIANIYIEAYYGLQMGIASTSVLEAEDLTIKVSGIFTEVGSGWSPGVLYYVSGAGTLTSTAPTSGIICQIASGVDIDTVLINPKIQIIT